MSCRSTKLETYEAIQNISIDYPQKISNVQSLPRYFTLYQHLNSLDRIKNLTEILERVHYALTYTEENAVYFLSWT